jgi:hypothetical protein
MLGLIALIGQTITVNMQAVFMAQAGKPHLIIHAICNQLSVMGFYT